MTPASTTVGEEFRDDHRRRRPLTAEALGPLTKIDDAKAATAVVETLLVLALCMSASAYFWNPWVVIPALVIIATRQQACFVLAHEAAHYRLFGHRRLNDWVGRMLAAPVGISMCTYRVVHRLHHNHLYAPNDPDTPIHGGYPRGRRYLAKKLGKDLLGFTAYKTYAYFFGAPVINDDIGDKHHPLNDTSPALRRAARQDRWTVVAFHLLAPTVAFGTGFGSWYLVLWILPLVTLLQALLRFRSILEHGAVTDFSSPLTAARTNLGPRWFIWLLFPHNVNYHIEHHLYPAIPQYHLPACHRLLKESGALSDAEVCSVFETARRVITDPTPKTAIA